MSNDTVTMVFPTPVNLNVVDGDGKRQCLKFGAGINEVPAEHAEHPYLKDNGVTTYDAKANAAALREAADAAQAKADEAAAKVGKKAEKGAAPTVVGGAPAAAPAAPGAPSADAAVDPDDLTIAELKVELESRGVEYDAGDKKDDLVKQLKKSIKAA